MSVNTVTFYPTTFSANASTPSYISSRSTSGSSGTSNYSYTVKAYTQASYLNVVITAQFLSLDIPSDAIITNVEWGVDDITCPTNDITILGQISIGGMSSQMTYHPAWDLWVNSGTDGMSNPFDCELTNIATAAMGFTISGSNQTATTKTFTIKAPWIKLTYEAEDPTRWVMINGVWEPLVTM